MGLVLVLDDHDPTRYAVLRMLERWGHQTLGCDSGESAIAQLVEHHPNLMIVDAMMPGMTGAEFVRIIRSNPDTALIPAVLYTATSDQAIMMDALGKGANEVWHKATMDFPEMQERVEHFVNGSGKPR